MKNEHNKKQFKVREEIAFNFFEHFNFLGTDCSEIKDKEQIVKTKSGWYRIMYRDTAGNTRFCRGCYTSLDTLIEKERISMNKCVCLN